MALFQVAALGDTVYFHFSANDTGGSGADGASPVFDVRLCGGAAADAPVLSGSATLLTHANYLDGTHEVAIAATGGNGFAAGNTYAVFVTLSVDGETPGGFLGSFRLVAAGAAPIMRATVEDVDADLSGTHGAGSWETADLSGVPAAVDAELSGTHGAGSWETADLSGVPAAVDAELSGTHGAGSWESGGIPPTVDEIADEIDDRHGEGPYDTSPGTVVRIVSGLMARKVTNLELTQGRYHEFSLEFTDAATPTPNPVDLTDYIAGDGVWLTVKDAEAMEDGDDSGAAIRVQGTSSVPTSGIATFVVPVSEAENLEPGEGYFFDVVGDDGAGKVVALLEGTVTAKRPVRRS
jgi:hypothetical protein